MLLYKVIYKIESKNTSKPLLQTLLLPKFEKAATRRTYHNTINSTLMKHFRQQADSNNLPKWLILPDRWNPEF